jgi:hypothetical protein
MKLTKQNILLISIFIIIISIYIYKQQNKQSDKLDASTNMIQSLVNNIRNVFSSTSKKEDVVEHATAATSAVDVDYIRIYPTIFNDKDHNCKEFGHTPKFEKDPTQPYKQNVTVSGCANAIAAEYPDHKDFYIFHGDEGVGGSKNNMSSNEWVAADPSGDTLKADCYLYDSTKCTETSLDNWSDVVGVTE